MPREMYAGYFKPGKFRTDKVVHPTTGKEIRVRVSEAIKNVRPWAGMDHWDYYVIVSYEGQSLSLPYSTGIGWEKGALKGADVIETLVSDYSPEGYTFEEFADDLGYERDAAARKIYAAVSRQNEAMRRVFGDDLASLIENWEH